MIAVTTATGERPPPGLVPVYACPRCGVFYAAGEVPSHVAIAAMKDLRRTRAGGGGD